MNERTKQALNKFLGRIPLHIVIIVLCLIWIVPTLGLLISSFRPSQDINETGWWTVFSLKSTDTLPEYETYCASCHGPEGNAIADLVVRG